MSNFSNCQNNSIHAVCDTRWNSKVCLVRGEPKPLFFFQIFRKTIEMDYKCRDFSIKNKNLTKQKINEAHRNKLQT